MRFTAYNVIDPVGGGKLEGKHEVKITCDTGPIFKTLLFTRGTTSPPFKIRCTIIDRPVVNNVRFQF